MQERQHAHAHEFVWVGVREEPDADLGFQVETMRTAMYDEARRAELAELEADLALLEAEEGLSSADLAARMERGELPVTMRRAWWLAQWRLRERLVATRPS